MNLFNQQNMKALFLVFYGFQEYNGISKKIKYQVNALKKCGLDIRTCYYEVAPDGSRQWLIDNKTLTNLGKGIIAKLKNAYPSTLSFAMWKKKTYHSYIYVPITMPIPSRYIL